MVELLNSFKHILKTTMLSYYVLLLHKLKLISLGAIDDGTDILMWESLINLNGPTEDYSFIDVGANLGDWTSAFIQIEKVKYMNAILVEPIPEFFDLLSEKFFSKENISVLNIALSNNNDKNYAIAQVGQGGRRHLTYNSPKKVSWFTANAFSGDSIVRTSGIKPKVIKIDCDGDDFFVIQGFVETLKIFRPAVQFEHFNPFALEAKIKLKHITKFFESLGYVVFCVTRDRRLVKVKFPSLESLGGSKNYMALPTNWKYEKM